MSLRKPRRIAQLKAREKRRQEELNWARQAGAEEMRRSVMTYLDSRQLHTPVRMTRLTRPASGEPHIAHFAAAVDLSAGPAEYQARALEYARDEAARSLGHYLLEKGFIRTETDQRGPLRRITYTVVVLKIDNPDGWPL